jgi:hypothetical protein
MGESHEKGEKRSRILKILKDGIVFIKNMYNPVCLAADCSMRLPKPDPLHFGRGVRSSRSLSRALKELIHMKSTHNQV